MSAPDATADLTGAAPVPLSRNREYRLLWVAQALSEFGFNASAIAFPLLVLAVTGSAAASGLVLGTVAAAQLVAGVPAGALVDRWNRKAVMLACELAQAVAAATLVAAVWTGTATLAHMVAVAAVIGVCAALFVPAEEATLPNVVPSEQVASAVALNAARGYLGQLSGTAVGGFLFALGRAVPFLADLVTHTLAAGALSLLRLPPRPAPTPDEVRQRHLGREMLEGLRWVWGQRHIRVTALLAVVLNLFFSAFYLVVIVLAEQRRVPSGQIGVMAAMLGVGGVLGALAAPRLHRVLSPYASIVGVFWVITLLTPVAAVARQGWVLGALFAAMAFLPPTANTTITSRQLLLTPDELRGRLSGVLGLVVGLAAVAGPALGGLLVQWLPGGAAVLVCTAGLALVTLLATASPTLRSFPREAEPEPSGVLASPVDEVRA